MGKRLGIIAGSGEFPFVLCKEAQERGYHCVVAGIKGESEPGLEEKADIFNWFNIQDLSSLVAFFQRNHVDEAVFAGKIDHKIIYKNKALSRIFPAALAEDKEKGPSALIQWAIRVLAQNKIAIKDPTPYISSVFCRPGVLTRKQPSPEVEEDIRFGWKMARNLADSDIGQTVVVKEKAVVAVEGMEGTDETIKRGGLLAGEGIVVVKVSRSAQDPRIDLPAVGLNTIKTLIKAGGLALGLEAGKVAFFQKQDALSLADDHQVSVIVKK